MNTSTLFSTKVTVYAHNDPNIAISLSICVFYSYVDNM